MRHNAHYTTKYDTVNLPCKIEVYTNVDNDLVGEFTTDDQLGDLVDLVSEELQFSVITIKANGDTILTLFAIPPTRGRLSCLLRDAIVAYLHNQIAKLHPLKEV